MHDCSWKNLMCTASGASFDPLQGDIARASISDVAHALSRTPRFCGQTSEGYSVAEHAVWLSEHVPAPFALAALLRSTPAAFIGDLPRPVKRRLPSFRQIEARLRVEAVRLFAGRNRAPKHGDMDAWDDIAMLVQWRDLKDPLLAWWDVDPGILLDFERIRPVAPELAARRFIARYECLASGASRPADRRIVDAANALPSDGLHSRPEVVTYTHRLVDPFDVAPGQIDIRDIARGLSRMPRFAGHTIQPYSVAQHSIFVARNSRRRLLGLLHDATESYIIDLARPVKAGVDGYALMERRLGRSIYEQLGVRPPSEKPPCVQRADALSAAVEQRDLMNAQGGWWRRPEIPDVPELQVSPQHAVEAQFVEIFYELRAGRNPFLSDSPWPAAS